ncbi:PKD domain-containing protein [Methanoregula sp.]|jgi:PKD repeat protein|uniref:PKD domain-containing protein n=1 Tax=Methanoregula sp. TaxID=2052170 RepID=UPI0025E08F7D|nr:PKD domain-containing protein [Methanoregula sp.]
MKIKIPRIQKQIRIPRLRKQIRVPFIIGLVILLLLLGIYFHLVPGPGDIAHMFVPKVTATPVQSVASADASLTVPLAQPLIADCLASPNRSDPLSVQFFDMGRGGPAAWSWDFGDNTTSDVQNPVHEYTIQGIYNVTLTVTREDGARSTTTAYDVLDTRQDTASSVLIDTIRQGVIKKGSFLAFESVDSNSSVTVNGVRTPLPAGSLVKIRADSDTSGIVTLRHGNIMSCSFAAATFFMNGNQVARGSFGDCLVPGVRNYHANLTFAIVPTLGEVRQILINGSKIRAGPENSYILVTQDTTGAGNDLTLINLPGYFEGSANSFSLSPVLIAGFITTSLSRGNAPLNVSFMDRSAGFPDAWLWDFGDGTTTQEQNPTHTYVSVGTYTVTLTVKNTDQTDTAIQQDAVIVTPPRVVANLSARPLKGTAPLTVRFTDQSTGFPTAWNWTIQEVTYNQSFMGNGTSPLAVSSDQNPLITFPEEGVYNVWLAANNIYGSSDVLKSRYIVVTAPYSIPDKDLVLKTGKSGYLEKDSSIQFVVQDTPATITINGAYRELPKGAVVRIVADSNQQGDITIDSDRILKFDFPDMAVYVNGDLFAVGRIDSVYIPSMEQFNTDLTYYFSPKSAQTYEVINGQKMLSNLDNAWLRFYNLGMNEQGSLSLISGTNSTYIDGAINRTVQDWALDQNYSD